MRIGLAVKYTLIISLVLVVVMSVNGYLHIRKVQKVIVEKAIHEADLISEMIILDSYHLMLEENRPQLQLMIEKVGASNRVSQVRILGRGGLIDFSADRSEIGKFLDRSDPSCNFCHLSDSTVLDNSALRTRSQVFTAADDKQYLRIIRVISTDPNSTAAVCHFNDEALNRVGILDMVVTLDQMADLARTHHRDVIVSTLIILFLLSLSHYLLTRQYLSKPLKSLLQQTRELARGNLSARVVSIPKDEIGELTRSFNEMAENLAQAQTELRQWGETLEHKVEKRTAEMARMQSQLVRTAKLASMGQLVAGVAHEINNPLTGILMFASLSARNQDLPQQVKDNLQLIITETNRCTKIVKGLLEFARESIPEKRPTDINELLRQTVSLVSQQTLFQNIEIDCDYCDRLPHLEADSDQLKQVFFNMIINAGQAMPNGGTLQIKTRLLENGDEVVVVIEDSGVGISPENLERIFDPFFSTKSEEGFGLGLSVSYGIVRNHGGRFDVISKEGQGTSFRIYLPLVQDKSISQED